MDTPTTRDPQNHREIDQSAPQQADDFRPFEEVQGCTAAQLRRFIKSRAYVPMHELRRRFELNGAPDDVCCVHTSSGPVYLGLPARESQLIGDLVRQGDVGLELCRDPETPIVVGVYPTRPITRH